MNSKSTPNLSRRRFVAAAAGMIVLPGSIDLSAAADSIGETDHFWYRLASKDGPYIDTQRDHKAFGIGDGKIFVSALDQAVRIRTGENGAEAV